MSSTSTSQVRQHGSPFLASFSTPKSPISPLITMPEPQDCQAEACTIQDCLTRHNYNESKCQSAVQALYRCCDAMYAQAIRDGKSADEAKSTACPVKSVVDRKMKQWAREAQ